MTLLTGTPILLESGAKRLGRLFALWIELALFGYVLGIEWVGIGLIRVGGTVANDDHKSARTKQCCESQRRLDGTGCSPEH